MNYISSEVWGSLILKYYKCSKCDLIVTDNKLEVYKDPISGQILRFHKEDHGIVERIVPCYVPLGQRHMG